MPFHHDVPAAASMKALPKRKGNFKLYAAQVSAMTGLNESPSEKEGKFSRGYPGASIGEGLNESPSEKEGKSTGSACFPLSKGASMKALPKRKGNAGHQGQNRSLQSGPQ